MNITVWTANRIYSISNKGKCLIFRTYYSKYSVSFKRFAMFKCYNLATECMFNSLTLTYIVMIWIFIKIIQLKDELKYSPLLNKHAINHLVHTRCRRHSPDNVDPWISRKPPGGRFNIKIPSYQYRGSHVTDKTVSQTVLSLASESPNLGRTVFILKRARVSDHLTCPQFTTKLRPLKYISTTLSNTI